MRGHHTPVPLQRLNYGTLVLVGDIGITEVGVVRWLVRQLLIFEGQHAQPQMFRLLDHHVLNGLELLLLRERQMLPGCILVVTLQLVAQMVPYLVALRDGRELRQLIHDGVHLCLERLLQIAVHFFAGHIFQLVRQLNHLHLNDRALTDGVLHLLNQFAQGHTGLGGEFLV